jgi:hypothetical protein
MAGPCFASQQRRLEAAEVVGVADAQHLLADEGIRIAAEDFAAGDDGVAVNSVEALALKLRSVGLRRCVGLLGGAVARVMARCGKRRRGNGNSERSGEENLFHSVSPSFILPLHRR